MNRINLKLKTQDSKLTLTEGKSERSDKNQKSKLHFNPNKFLVFSYSFNFCLLSFKL